MTVDDAILIIDGWDGKHNGLHFNSNDAALLEHLAPTRSVNQPEAMLASVEKQR